MVSALPANHSKFLVSFKMGDKHYVTEDLILRFLDKVKACLDKNKSELSRVAMADRILNRGKYNKISERVAILKDIKKFMKELKDQATRVKKEGEIAVVLKSTHYDALKTSMEYMILLCGDKN